jgi:hypothetical protein
MGKVPTDEEMLKLRAEHALRASKMSAGEIEEQIMRNNPDGGRPTPTWLRERQLTLRPQRWYAMLTVHPEGAQDVSPIWLKEVRELPSGKGLLELTFWHANYPAGVQFKSYALRVLRREMGFLLAERHDVESKDLVLVSDITKEWVEHHFRESPTGWIQKWLDQRCGPA